MVQLATSAVLWCEETGSTLGTAEKGQCPPPPPEKGFVLIHARFTFVIWFILAKNEYYARITYLVFTGINHRADVQWTRWTRRTRWMQFCAPVGF